MYRPGTADPDPDPRMHGTAGVNTPENTAGGTELNPAGAGPVAPGTGLVAGPEAATGPGPDHPTPRAATSTTARAAPNVLNAFHLLTINNSGTRFPLSNIWSATLSAP